MAATTSRCATENPAAPGDLTGGIPFADGAGEVVALGTGVTRFKGARTLGAFVNYRTEPEWQKTVRALTGGAGVKQVLEVGSRSTFAKALEALAFDGHIAMIGTLSGFAEQLPTGPLFQAGAHLTAVYVGSRADFEAPLRAGAVRAETERS